MKARWFLGSAIAIVAGYFLLREPLYTDPQLTGPWQKGKHFLIFDENHSAYLAKLHEGSLLSASVMRYSAAGGKLRVEMLDEEGGTGPWTTYEMHIRSEDGKLSLNHLPDRTRNAYDVLGRMAGGGHWQRACVTVDYSREGHRRYTPCEAAGGKGQ